MTKNERLALALKIEKIIPKDSCAILIHNDGFTTGVIDNENEDTDSAQLLYYLLQFLHSKDPDAHSARKLMTDVVLKVQEDNSMLESLSGEIICDTPSTDSIN